MTGRGALILESRKGDLVERWDLLAWVSQHLDNVSGQTLANLTMSWHRLRNLRLGILIPIVSLTMPNQHTAHLFQFFDEVSSFHGTSSSPTLLTHGIVPLVSSS